MSGNRLQSTRSGFFGALLLMIISFVLLLHPLEHIFTTAHHHDCELCQVIGSANPPAPPPLDSVQPPLMVTLALPLPRNESIPSISLPEVDQPRGPPVHA